MSLGEKVGMDRPTAAIVGTGFMARTHLEALRRIGVRVVGVAASSEEKSSQAAQSFGLEKAYRNYEELLADDSVDAVHLCVPNRLHYEMARRAMACGKHVMCEKPLAMTAEESGALTVLAGEHDLAAAVCYNLRYYPLNFQARDFVKKGDLGRLFHIQGCYIQDWLQFSTDNNWRVDANQGGALRAIADIGTHWMDMVQMITGQRITQVFADLAIVHDERPVGGSGSSAKGAKTALVDTEDFGSILFRTEDDIRGCFFVSQVAAGRKNTIRYEISGEKGALAWDSERPNELWLGYREKANQILAKDPSLMSETASRYAGYPGGHNEGYPDTFKQCFQAFYDYIEAGDYNAPAPYPTFEDGHRELLLCEAILKSYQQESWANVYKK